MKNKIYIIAILVLFVDPILSQKSQSSIELILPDSGRTDPGWGETDGFKNLEILGKIDGKKSESKLEEAASHYRKAIEHYQNTEKLIESKKEEYEIAVFPEDRFEWQKRARRDSQDRELAKILWDGRGISIQHLIRGMDVIDSIENPRILQSENFKDLRAGLYREYIKHQYAMKNYSVAMDMTHRYILLDDKFYNEAEPHRILAVCYEKMEESAKKSKKHELTMNFKEKKKHHLATYAEIHYGKESGEYQAIMDKVMRDY